jgi:cell division transport system permease protein
LILLVVALYACNSRNKTIYTSSIRIYLEDFDSSRLQPDLQWLATLPYAVEVKFISKEDAKKQYISEGNDDWSQILDTNPLPNAYEVIVDIDKMRSYDPKSVEADMRSHIQHFDDMVYPDIIYGKFSKHQKDRIFEKREKP